jgi:lipopolysaccharide export system permease protein
MLPLGVFLTRRATADRGLFEFESILQPLKRIFKFKDRNGIDYKFLSDYNNEKLIDAINNYVTLDHDETIRFKAIELLHARGLSTPDLRTNGLNIHKDFDTTEAIKKDYEEHAKFAWVMYIIGAVLLVLFFVFKNNKLPSLASPSIQLSIISLVLYVVYLIKSIINTFQFYTHIRRKQKKPKILPLILGLPFYFMTYLFLNQKMKDDLKVNCLESLK